jgi:hypothetical protein
MGRRNERSSHLVAGKDFESVVGSKHRGPCYRSQLLLLPNHDFSGRQGIERLEKNVKGLVWKLCLCLLTGEFLVAQTITPISPPPSLSAVLPQAGVAPTGDVLSTDLVFPHFAFGGGWNTTLVIVNMSPQTVSFDQYFVDPFGNPLTVTFQAIPGGQFETTSAGVCHRSHHELGGDVSMTSALEPSPN